MLYRVEQDSPVPIYEQIVAQVIFGIAGGALEAGTLIPSVRELAGRLTVHPNTVARAYQELERRGLVVARRGRGMEVAAEAPALSREARNDIVRGRIRAALREAVSSALPADEVRRVVDEELRRVNGQAD
ncbi:MAG: GntR family transcriptional regulator [Gemmataceae bacterium]